MKSTEQVTQLLSKWRNGDRAAFDSLFSLVYDELRAIASSYMSRERPDHTLQTTALVNEAYIKLVGQSDALWENRVYFFAIAAKIMRTLNGLALFSSRRYSFSSLTTDFKWRFEHRPSVSSSSTPTRMEFQPTRALIGHNFRASCLLGVASEAPMKPQAARGIALSLCLKDLALAYTEAD